MGGATYYDNDVTTLYWVIY